MKINYKYGIRTISGKLDDLVHMAWNKGRVGVVRLFVMPTLVAQHFQFRDIKHNIAEIWASCSSDFKEDFKTYAVRRVPYYTAEEIPAYASYAHFIRFLYAYAQHDEAINLAETDKVDLETAGCPGTVADIVAGGYLPVVPDAEELSSNW